MSQELTASLIARVNQSHASFMECGKRLVDNLLDTVNAARETGVFLLELKDNTKHGDFAHYFLSSNPNQGSFLCFGERWGQIIMRLAKRAPEPITELPEAVRSLKDVLVLYGALPESARGEQTASDLGPFAKAESILGRFWAVINKEIEKTKPHEWSSDRRAHMKEQLRPAVELYEQL